MRTGESPAARATLFPVLKTKPINRLEAALTPARANGHAVEVASGSAPDAHAAEWLVWQLIDSAFPTGGFAHSSGLEAAWQHGEVRNRAELQAFLVASLDQLGNATLPFVTAAHESPDKLAEIDRLCDAFTTNHVANRASRAQGRALMSAVERIFAPGASLALEGAPLHFAPVFGSVTRRLNLSRSSAQHMFVFTFLRGVLASAVRLNIIGPMEAQMFQHRLQPKAAEILAACASLTLDDLAQTAPLLDLWQGAQDRLYSRLFQS